MENKIKTRIKKSDNILRFSLFCIVIAFLQISGITACKTTGNFFGTAMLTVMIVDENGKGINDFNLELANFNRTQKGITSSNGMCVFNNIPSGEYQLSGNKNFYSKLKPAKILFNNKSEVFCFEIKSSARVLDEAAKLYSLEKYEEGLLQLNLLLIDKKSDAAAAVCFYKAFGYAALKDSKKALTELKKMKSASVRLAEKYSPAVEQKIKEVSSE